MEIDANGRRYRKYADYFGMKFGTWTEFPFCSELILQLSVESKTVNSRAPSPYGGTSGKVTFKSITYDIMLTEGLGNKTLFHEFMKYKTAKEALAVIAQTLNLEPVDRVAEKLAENRERRNRRQ